MADRDLTADSKCGYCYQEFSSMRDPRELPCHHSFCLKCLKEDFEKHGVVSCPLCNRKYESEEAVDELPSAMIPVQKENASSASATTMGDKCGGCGKRSEDCSCLQCSDGISVDNTAQCRSTFKISQSGAGILNCEQSAKRKKETCKIHNEEFSRGCSDCGRLVCDSCDQNPAKFTGETFEHSFMSLSELEEKITAELDKLLQLANEKLTEICVKDKELWSTLDKEEGKCKEKMEFIDRVCEEQIKRIREKSEKLKERIRDYQKRLTNQVEVYNSELMTRKQQLEESLAKVRKHLIGTQETELVRRRDELKNDLRRSLSKLSHQLISEPFPVCERVSGKVLDIKLANIPKTLTLTSKCLMSSTCYTVYHTRHRGLLVGQNSGITLVRGTSAKTLLSKDTTTCAVEHKDVTSLLETNYSSTISRYLSDLSKKEQLFTTYTPHYNRLCPLAVSDEFIVCCTQKKKLTIYNTQSQQSTDAELEDTPRALYFLPTGELLVTSWVGDSDQGGALTSYQVENQKLITVWRCEGLQDAFGVCENDGLIYVSTSISKSIHILSLQGKILHKIEEEQLPKRAGQISVRGDELAVPSLDDRQVYMFNINH